MFSEHTIRRLFKISLLIKGLDGAFETIGGIVLLVVGPETLSKTIVVLTQHELVEDPRDIVAHFLRMIVSGITADTALFAAVYLLVHGLIKLLLVRGLLRDELWAYPTALVFLVLFLAYQIYRLSYQYSLVLLLLSIFDAFIIILISHEYRYLKRHSPTLPA